MSDKKIPKLAGSSLQYFNPDVKAYNDYYPFGMLLPGRHANTSDYRYGFQGQEMDDELKGEGNSVNYRFRMHDPRVGRFFAVDPLTAKYPHYTPYSFSGNKVIAYGELEGLEEYEANLLNGHKVRMYNIRPGENLSVISKTTSVAVQDIIGLNVFKHSPEIIYPNEKLIIDTDLESKLFQEPMKAVEKSSEFSVAKWTRQFIIELATSNENGSSVQSLAKTYLGFSMLRYTNPSSLFSRQGLAIGLGKTGISAGTQASFGKGEVNVTGAFADGFLKLPIGALVGSSFETNFNVFTRETSYSNIFDGTKSYKEAGFEAGSSLFFGGKTNIFSKYLSDPASKTLGEMILETSNQIGNYGLQKGIENKNVDDGS